MGWNIYRLCDQGEVADGFCLDAVVSVGDFTYDKVHDYGKRFTLLYRFLHDRDHGTTCSGDSAFYCPKAMHVAKNVWQKKKRLVFTVACNFFQLCYDFMSTLFLCFLGTPKVSCVPSVIRGKGSDVGKKLLKHKRGTQYTLHSSDGSLNFTLWKDGSIVLFADNDFDASVVADISGKIWNKKKKIYHGRRTYKANEAVRCYRDTHNNVDIHNQLCAYGHWDYRTRRKQMRVPKLQPYLVC